VSEPVLLVIGAAAGASVGTVVYSLLVGRRLLRAQRDVLELRRLLRMARTYVQHQNLVDRINDALISTEIYEP
jgi:hypothetical protein